MLHLSRAQARRIALAAQGFLDPAHAVPTLRTFQRTLERTGVLQVDSVNVLQRAHYMPLYSRMGPYDVGLLERASSGRERRRMVEYWAHVQAFMPVELWPHMRHRMERYRAEKGKWGLWDDRPDFEQEVLTAVRDRGPVTARTSTTSSAARGPSSTGAGTGRRRGGAWTTCSWSARSRSPGATASSRSSTTCPSGCCPRPCWRRRRPPRRTPTASWSGGRPARTAWRRSRA